jgi:hypothetical protein
MKTLRISREEAERLNLSRFPNAGPYPNVAGMKRIWGGGIYGAKEVLCVQADKYLYHVDADTYYKISGGTKC